MRNHGPLRSGQENPQWRATATKRQEKAKLARKAAKKNRKKK
jgi:hypothetical protein